MRIDKRDLVAYNYSNPTMKKAILFTLIILALVGSFFIYQKTIVTRQTQSIFSDPNVKKIQVTTSFYPLYFFAREIGADTAEVKNITPAGVEPHEYDPTTSDIARIEKSNVLILNGTVETWGDKIKENLKGTPVVIITASDGLMNQQLIEDSKVVADPHVWLSPRVAKKQVERITTGFVQVDPQNSSYYQANEKKLIDQLDQLDKKFKEGLASCKQKDIITSHAAFGYLASAYGLTQISISGLSSDAEPSAGKMVEIVKFAKERNIKYIFFESLVSPKLSDTIASEIGAKTLVLDPLEGLTDNDIKHGKNYFSVMEENLKNLQIALQCNR